MIKTDTLIIGAGVSGLSCAYHLQKRGAENYILAEKAEAEGGLCGSFFRDGFVFDWSGHLLHLHTREGENLVRELLGGNVLKLRRKAWIHSHGVETPYPFQANTFGLPLEVVSECVSGFIKALRAGETAPADGPFRDWALSVFGEGICRNFMFPYNLKLWRTPLEVLTADWCAAFVPRPRLEDVVAGAYRSQKKPFGYNASFYYPKKGGIGSLCRTLAKNLSGLRLSAEVTSVSLSKKTAVVSGLGEVSFKKLVNTMPLKDFIGLIKDSPAALKKSGEAMKCTGVTVFNLGVNRKISDKHWIYFPEKDFPFYRVGFASNFSPFVSPKGRSSLYVEVSHREGEKPDFGSLEKKTIAALRNSGILRKGDAVSPELRLSIPRAYVVYDSERKKAVSSALDFLRRRGIQSIGRYGAWKYSFMEEALLEGKAAAMV